MLFHWMWPLKDLLKHVMIESEKIDCISKLFTVVYLGRWPKHTQMGIEIVQKEDLFLIFDKTPIVGLSAKMGLRCINLDGQKQFQKIQRFHLDMKCHNFYQMQR